MSSGGRPDTRANSDANAAYDALAIFYDELEGDRSNQAEYLRGLLRRHCPQARSLLELACGTGAILAHLEAEYESVAGVDVSAPMLEAASRAVPRADLFRQDIRKLALKREFDAILCVFDSINHLTEFDDWEAVFDRAADHLAPGGIFLFDLHTPRRLLELMEEPAHAKWFGDGHLVVIEVGHAPTRPPGGVATTWQVDVFEHAQDGLYRRHALSIQEVSFETSRIESTLEQRFSQITLYDPQQKEVSKDTRRLHVVCEK
jgi:SAM-dependent methyltransferase